MSIKDDLLWTIETFSMGWSFRPLTIHKRSKASMELGVDDLFYNYIDNYKSSSGFVEAWCYNPIFHMLNHTPAVSCFYDKQSDNTTFVVDSHRKLMYIVNNNKVMCTDTKVKYMYPDSIMLAWAAGKLPYLLSLYASDINKILYGWTQNSSAN